MSNNKEMSFLYSSNAAYIEELYERYLQDPALVDAKWQMFFSKFSNDKLSKPSWKRNQIIFSEKPNEVVKKEEFADKSEHSSLLEAYRRYGHYFSNLDPLGQEKMLDLGSYNLSPDDRLQKIYSSNVGYEFSHLASISEMSWLYDYVESNNKSEVNNTELRKKALLDMVEFEGLEEYLHVKFPGAKRFSVEGGESSLVCLQEVIRLSNNLGMTDLVIGMAHRGRLNVLTKVMGKPYSALLAEFQGIGYPDNKDFDYAGDVKYHMGYSSSFTGSSGQVTNLSLVPNPSHLEAVNPVVEGKLRAKQDLIRDLDRKKSMAILIHGDAAFCGQGVVAESLTMSCLNAYNTGGTVHIVINNQVGFTANASDGRVGRYATEFAKVIGAPVIHVNGDDVDMVLFVTGLALQYRQKFSKSIVLDIVCYRKYGHNEGDEPMFTQPLMYNLIKSRPTPASVYANKLLAEGVIDSKFYEDSKNNFRKYLEKEFELSKNYSFKPSWLSGIWSNFTRPFDSRDCKVKTGVDKEKLVNLAMKISNEPKDFSLNSKIKRFLQNRAEMTKDLSPVDWGMGEALAFASLLDEGFKVRITGQDSGRGTFSHRHSILHDQTNGKKHCIFSDISPAGSYEVADSNLSEYGVLGFEYGYALGHPNALVIWEAQFGDFANGAQIVFDQFIAAAETKWFRMNGIVVLLPHGYEGQGPEHSSARLERFLQLAAEDNIQVAVPTTPASLFHLLRRQMLRNFRKPLIIMSPKSLIRHKMAVSNWDEFFENAEFIPLIDEVSSELNKNSIKRLVICSGKVYYDLLNLRNERAIKDIALIRLEQYYPLPENELFHVINSYSKLEEIVWCQEEPKNMGAWSFISNNFAESDQLSKFKISYCGRKRSASTAVGSLKEHNNEQDRLLKQALKIGD